VTDPPICYIMTISDMPHLAVVCYVYAWLIFCTFLKNAEVKNSWISFGVRFKYVYIE